MLSRFKLSMCNQRSSKHLLLQWSTTACLATPHRRNDFLSRTMLQRRPQQQPQEGDYGQEGQTAQQHYSYPPTNSFDAPPGGCGSSITDALPPSSIEGAAIAVAVGSCVRCGHMAHSAEDRFCSACGGSIRR
jgi:hypothetical protein